MGKRCREVWWSVRVTNASKDRETTGRRTALCNASITFTRLQPVPSSMGEIGEGVSNASRMSPACAATEPEIRVCRTRY